MPSIKRADRSILIPPKASNWTGEDAQYWARNEVLFGGPPDKPIDPQTGEEVDWPNVRHYVGKKLQFRARPMGLIFQMADGTRKYVPGDASSSTSSGGFSIGTSTDEMRQYSEVEKKLRTFCRDELARYNKTTTAAIREGGRRATYEFWLAGKRIREFLKNNPSLNQDRIWYSLEQWGRGAGGYAKNWYEDATYFFDWAPDIPPDDPAFGLSETRIMNIRRASKTPAGRKRLLEASVAGLFTGLTDEEFKWATGQSRTTFPLSSEEFAIFSGAGRSLSLAQEPTANEAQAFQALLGVLRRKG